MTCKREDEDKQGGLFMYTMYNDLGQKRRGTAAVKGRGWSGNYWKIAVSIILGLALFAAVSQRKSPAPTIAYRIVESAQQVLKNCTTPSTNVSCNCPPAAPNIDEGVPSDGVLRLANKVTSTTVDNILDAASSKDPAGQTVRVCILF